MNKHKKNGGPPPKRRKKPHKGNKKIGAAMMLLGLLAILALFLPANDWAILLSIALIAFGIIVLKTTS